MVRPPPFVSLSLHSYSPVIEPNVHGKMLARENHASRNHLDKRLVDASRENLRKGAWERLSVGERRLSACALMLVDKLWQIAKNSCGLAQKTSLTEERPWGNVSSRNMAIRLPGIMKGMTKVVIGSRPLLSGI